MKKILNLLISLFRSKRVFNNKIEYKNQLGQYHRTDGPAIENIYYEQWWINGKQHREDGPAVESDLGYKAWLINNKLLTTHYVRLSETIHREDGPAVEYDNGDKSWYLNDIKYIEEEFHQELIKLKLKRLIEL
jgi:hypothetical protein